MSRRKRPDLGIGRERQARVMGEGAGVLLLETLEHALARGTPIYAEYLGGAVNCDAHHMTDPRVDGGGVALCMEQALDAAGVSKNSVNYINAHATATLAGDLCEIAAIRKVFGPHANDIKINSTKSMIGHCLGAAGGLEAVATIQAIRTGMLHPTIIEEDPEPALDGIDAIPCVAKPHKVEVALSNSFGFGGHNSTLVFRSVPPMNREDESFGIIPLSKESGRWQVFLIQHRGRRTGDFQKGMLKKRKRLYSLPVEN